jgi:hypothetical protein
MSQQAFCGEGIPNSSDYNDVLLHTISEWPKWKLVSLSTDESDQDFLDIVMRVKNITPYKPVSNERV